MEHARRGYTIIEVMLVLAVSGVLFISAAALFRGKQGQTQFSQAMHDVDSKIQAAVNDVGVSVFPNAEKYSCDTNSGGRPFLSPVGSGSQATGSNQKCIFLGKAIQATTGQSQLRIYTVLGNRLNSATGEPATLFDQTNPEPAVDSSGNFIPDLIEDYDLAFNAAYVTSARVNSNTTDEYDLAGFYNSLQTVSQQGNQSLLSKGYRTTNPSQVTVKSCIEQTACSPITIRNWNLCFTSRGSNENAQLVIGATPAGINTKLNFNSASC